MRDKKSGKEENGQEKIEKLCSAGDVSPPLFVFTPAASLLVKK
jgi:hypothetical protein